MGEIGGGGTIYAEVKTPVIKQVTDYSHICALYKSCGDSAILNTYFHLTIHRSMLVITMWYALAKHD